MLLHCLYIYEEKYKRARDERGGNNSGGDDDDDNIKMNCEEILLLLSMHEKVHDAKK